MKIITIVPIKINEPDQAPRYEIEFRSEGEPIAGIPCISERYMLGLCLILRGATLE